MVKESLCHLNIPFNKISLGKVFLQRPLQKDEKRALEKEFKKNGFDILEGKDERMANAVKSIVIREVYKNEGIRNQNLSAVLSEQLGYDYSYISTTFTKCEGKSIQDFQLEIKIKRIKELLQYNELSISEIAQELGYSSAAYLSTQFKKATGENPSEYKHRYQKEIIK